MNKRRPQHAQRKPARGGLSLRAKLVAVVGALTLVAAGTGAVAAATASRTTSSTDTLSVKCKPMKRTNHTRWSDRRICNSTTPTPTPTPTKTPTSAPPTTAAPTTPPPTTAPPTTAPPTTAAPTTAPPTTAPPTTSTPTTPPSGTTLMGWQLTASNVGLAPFGLSCSSLPTYTGPSKPAAGTQITQKRITTNLDLSAGDITISKSCIQPSSGDNRALVSNDVCGANECAVTAAKGVTIVDSEFDASAASASSIAASCAFRGIGDLRRNYMHGMGSGICFFGTGMKLSGVAENNYVTGLRSYGGSHNEAATVRDLRKDAGNTRSIRFTNNRLDCESGNETGGLFIQPTWVDIANVWVTGNYLEGGGYNLYLNQAGGKYSNVHATNNRMRPTGWGPSVVDPGPAWDEFSDNYRYDASKPNAAGTLVRQ